MEIVTLYLISCKNCKNDKRPNLQVPETIKVSFSKESGGPDEIVIFQRTVLEYRSPEDIQKERKEI